jgi:hypothetical protein
LLTSTSTSSALTSFGTSPALTGTPTVPTAAVDTNTTQVASTAFVVGQGYAKTSSLAASATTDTTNASNITSGTLPIARVQSSSTSQSGVVQLTDSTSSTSTTTAATPNSVKTSYDLANAALPKTGGTMTGAITTATASATQESLILPYGAAAPTSPTVGSLFSTGGGGFSALNYYNGVTKSTVLTASSPTINTPSIVYSGATVTDITGTGTNFVTSTSPTITTPSIASITGNASIASGSVATSLWANSTGITIGGNNSVTLTVATTTGTGTHSYSVGATASGSTKTINLGTGATAGTSTVTIGSTSATSSVTINNPLNAPNVQSGTTYTIPATTPTPNVVLTSATQVTLTLPTATAGKEIRILCQGAGGVISASSNVYPKTSRTLGTAIIAATGSALLVGDGTNWQVML